jgi:hypothetical protein
VELPKLNGIGFSLTIRAYMFLFIWSWRQSTRGGASVPRVAAFLRFVREAFADFYPQELTVLHADKLQSSWRRIRRKQSREF